MEMKKVYQWIQSSHLPQNFLQILTQYIKSRMQGSIEMIFCLLLQFTFLCKEGGDMWSSDHRFASPSKFMFSLYHALIFFYSRCSIDHSQLCYPVCCLFSILMHGMQSSCMDGSKKDIQRICLQLYQEKKSATYSSIIIHRNEYQTGVSSSNRVVN